MKRRCRIITDTALSIALACGITLWRDAQVIKWQTDHMPELKAVLTLAENRGADWATDELLINNVDSFRKSSLYNKWGEPTERSASEKENIRILSDQFRLIVDYDGADRIERIVVLPNESLSLSGLPTERSIHVCRNAVKTTGDEIIVKAPKTKAGNRYVYFSVEMESLLHEYEAFCAAETARQNLRKLTKDDDVFRRKGMQLPMAPSTFT